METVEIDGVSHRYYVLKRKLDFDEDEVHEFKGHHNFTKKQIPPHAHDPKYDRPSRQPVSKTMNAMLNSSTGGTIYIGVSDDATVHGILLNQYKMDHIEQNVSDVMHRYTPRVPSHRYSINFVPAVDTTNPDTVKKNLSSSSSVDEGMRQKAHSLRVYHHCWCDKLLRAINYVQPQYIVEIVIHAWEPADPRNDDLAVGKMRAHPIHINEEGRAYRRCNASVREFTVLELQALATKTVVDYYDPLQCRR